MPADAVRADGLPAHFESLKARLDYPLAWRPGTPDLAAWREQARAHVWQLTLQLADDTPFAPEVLAEEDRGDHLARRIAFNLTRDARVTGLLLLPKGDGPFPAVVMYHDHGSRFDIGKEKWISPLQDEARLASSQQWAAKVFEGHMPGDALARRGYAVFATDALGWGERGGLDYERQQALAANFFNLGSSLAGLMALEDTRAAAFLASLPQIDARRLAAVGFSLGAFRAWQATALSDAIQACVAVCWMARATDLMSPGNNSIRGNSAWHMIHPGLLRELDHPDLASLAAPKPFLLYSGDADTLFPLASVEAAAARMARVWQAWGATEHFTHRAWPSGHTFTAEQQAAAWAWLDNTLG
ncbi:MAG: hydrolase [Candidatus Dactylopiibacterium carminicum]|uniref:Hydrolase n=1 Tax=Candidatus Dactylopiibacterium carminicum TaxID=857335 RepID=A0A272EY93_9RHOO|nr:alpha/beta hydrolase family protein [Candidatus Dactylopiibacterium carminicum]KAF7600462.1 hydrolase [Candidatus Dactylopiibacterium carminicum]PAS95083.1 MAG: hydrolase [Candidatus Dactylopiibacterium carminicum]PAS97810.1 MAG: hydrolase [Candidatus Dactylopiibacterium carminicum]PAT00459.1 MAG: hydrolase [Candidatus Dactylopiibacterium carminicum]